MSPFIAKWDNVTGAEYPPFVVPSSRELERAPSAIKRPTTTIEVTETYGRVGAYLETGRAIDALKGAPTSLAAAIIAIESSGHAFGRGWTPKVMGLTAITNRFEPRQFKKTSPIEAKDLLEAWNMNPERSMESTSWGVGQVMGFNHHVIGYRTASEMVEAFRDVSSQVLATCFMVGYAYAVAGSRIDYDSIARAYNGPAAPSTYKAKLAAFHADANERIA